MGWPLGASGRRFRPLPSSECVALFPYGPEIRSVARQGDERPLPQEAQRLRPGRLGRRGVASAPRLPHGDGQNQV